MPTNHQELALQPSTLETVDAALTAYLDKTLDIRTTTNKGFEKVPVIWASTERAFQVKHNKDLRNQEGIHNLPVIVVSRGSIDKSMSDKGGVFGWVPSGYLTVSKRIQQDKTSNFANADSKRTYGQVNFKFPKNNPKVVYQHISVPQPIYVKVQYKLTLMSEYQQQLNDMMTPFFSKPGALRQVFIYDSGHRFEATFKEDYSDQGTKDNLGEQSRLFKSSVNIEVLGYTMGLNKNQEPPKILIEENAVEIKMMREQSMIGGITSMRPYAGGSKTGSGVTVPAPVVLSVDPMFGPATGG